MKIKNLSMQAACLTTSLVIGLAHAVLTPAWAAEAGIRHIAFSQDAKEILYLDERQARPQVRFLDAATGQETGTTELPVDLHQQVLMGFTPDGFKLALLEAKGLSILHNKTGKTLRTLPVPGLPSPLTQYHPADAITNASGTQQLFQDVAHATLNVVHTGNGKLLATIPLPAGRLQAMGMSADGRKVAYLMPGSNGQGELSVYDIYQHQVAQTVAVPMPGGAPFSRPVSFSSDGKYAALLPRLIDLSAGTSSKLVAASADTSSQAIFSSDSRTLWFGQQHQLMAYDLHGGGQRVVSLQLPASCRVASAYDFDPSGRWLVLGHQCAGEGVYLSVLDGKSGRLVHSFSP